MRVFSPMPLMPSSLRYSLSLAAAIAVMGDAEAVGLVAQLLHDAQTLAVFVDIKRDTVSGKIDFLEPFCYTDHGYHAAQSHVVESLYSGRQLTFAAVDNYET